MGKIAIYGAGGFGLEVAQLVEQINELKPQWQLIGFFDDFKNHGEIVNGYPVLGGIERLNDWNEELGIVLALGVPSTKLKVYETIDNHNIYFPNLIHPSAIIGSPHHVRIGDGCIICAGSIITTNIVIGRHVIFNLACTVGHEARIGDFSSFMPSCNISGKAEIGVGVFFGTGAKIINGMKVGDHSIIGAGAVIINDIPERSTAVGIPAKVIKGN